MKAILLEGNGEPGDVLTVGDIAHPVAPGDDEVAIRLTARVVHPADRAAIRGQLPTRAFVEDGVPGIDGVGVVESAGAGVGPATGIVAGARVLLGSARRTWAERLVTPVDALVPIPDDIDDAVAAQLALNGLTATMLLETAGRAAQDAAGDAPLLVSAAGGSVARMLIALAGAQKRRVIGLVRRDAEAPALAGRFENLTVFGTDRNDWRTAVRDAAKEPLPVALDPVGGATLPDLIDLLAPGGTLILYGAMDPRPSVSAAMLVARELHLQGTSVPPWLKRRPRAQRLADFAALFGLARRMPQLFEGAETFPLNEAVAAIAAAERVTHRGATILSS